MHCFLGAFGDPGHAFPMLALGAELVSRGHEVTLETWSRWREPAQARGMRFVAAPEYPVFPTRERPMSPYEAVAAAVLQTRPAVVSAAPEVVVHDVLTLAPALAAELEGVPTATLIPHLYPVGAPGLPPFGLGARAPRTRIGGALWRAFDPVVARGLIRGRDELNATRRRVGLPTLDHVFGGLSRELCLVATFPQLEYPRAWPDHVHVVGPLLWEPGGADVTGAPSGAADVTGAPSGAADVTGAPSGAADVTGAPSGGADVTGADAAEADGRRGAPPLVLIATSTAQDPDNRLLRAALRGLAGEPLRVLGVFNGRPLDPPVPVPANARVVRWLSYARVMPRCALVVCHAGSGTLGRALACGCPVLAVPHAGDMPENAARLVWTGAGRRLAWPLLSPWTLRHAVRRTLADPPLAARAAQLGAWAAAHRSAAHAADLTEALAARRSRDA